MKMPQSHAPWLVRCSLWLVLTLVVLDSAGYWLADQVIHPQASGWERAVFRPGGDLTYFPFIRALAEGNLGEPGDYATKGQGHWNFPWLQLAPFALLVKLFGPWGFLGADVLFQVARWYLLYRVLALLRLERTAALWVAALVSMSSLPYLVVQAVAWNAPFSMDRLPRPLITDVLFLGLSWCLLSALLSRPGRFPLAPLLGASVLAGLVPHGDLHGTFSLAPLFGIACGWLWWRERRGGWRTVLQVILSGLPAAILWGYWIYLVSLVAPEISRRLGTFSRDRWALPLPTEFYTADILLWGLAGLAVLAVALGLARKQLKSPDARELRILIMTTGVALVVAYLAPWIFLVGSGKLIQVYQFGRRALILEYFAIVFTLAALAQSALSARRSGSWGPWLALPVAGAGIWIVFAGAAAFREARQEFPAWATMFPRLQSKKIRYREDFRELEQTLLRQAPPKDTRVLATTDALISAWWLTARQGGGYTLDPFLTSLPDQELEDRLMTLGRVCGATNVGFIVNSWIGYSFHSVAKYQFSPATRFDSQTPLTPEQAERMKHIHFSTSWVIYVPPREVQRMEKRFAQLAAQPLILASIPFDLIIINSAHYEFFTEPDPRAFRKILENRTFRVYQKQAPPPTQ